MKTKRICKRICFKRICSQTVPLVDGHLSYLRIYIHFTLTQLKNFESSKHLDRQKPIGCYSFPPISLSLSSTL